MSSRHENPQSASARTVPRDQAPHAPQDTANELVTTTLLSSDSAGFKALPSPPSSELVNCTPSKADDSQAEAESAQVPAEKTQRASANTHDMTLDSNENTGEMRYMGQITRPPGIFASTPDLHLDINGKETKVPFPNVPKGALASFYTDGKEVIAKSGKNTYKLSYDSTWIVGGYSWKKY